MAFDDEENPNIETLRSPTIGAEDGAKPLDEDPEDEIPDYKLFASMFSKKKVSRKVIRKGEKDFESHGTQAQDNTLEASRQALEDVLSYTRVHRPETWIRAWYFPDSWATHVATAHQHDVLLHDRVVVVEHERGNWMRDIGRVVSGDKDRSEFGRLWLLPEEALYLIERGTVDIWWPYASLADLLPKTTSGLPARSPYGPDDYHVGIPLSLQAAYSLLIGYEGERGKTTLPKFQVYTHLKRAGFHVMRAATFGSCSLAQDESTAAESKIANASSSLWQWLFSFISKSEQSGRQPFGPLVSPGIYRAYRPIYRQLALLPHQIAHASSPSNRTQEPFRVHFHVWKPGGVPFSKKSPPPPDFRIAVVDTADSDVPALDQVASLLQSTPINLPRSDWQGPGRLYQRLKHGHRSVLVAVVDRGLVNFMRFGEGAFGDEVLYERFDNRSGGRGGKRGGRSGGRGRGRGRGRSSGPRA